MSYAYLKSSSCDNLLKKKWQNVVHLVRTFLMTRVRTTPENSCAPILFKILKRQYSYPENRGEHYPENSITQVLFKTVELLLRTVVH